jgi:predicted DNA-binding transcriptional regulator AlpA
MHDMERKPLTLGQIEDLCTAGKVRCDAILTHLSEIRRLMGEPLVPAEISAIADAAPAAVPALPAPRPRRPRPITKRGGVSDLAPAAAPAEPAPTGMVTVKQAKARAGCTDVTIYKALRDGDLKGQKLGPRKTMVWAESLDSWIAARNAAASRNASHCPEPPPPAAAPKRRGRPPKSPPPPTSPRIPLSSILHSPSSPSFPHVTRPRGDGSAEPINPNRFQPREPTPNPAPTVRRASA